jgi:hypothetical protein
MPESYSFSPQFATIRSASPLEGMRPVKAVHTALQFQPQKFLEVKSEQPELVSSAWASGLKEGVGDALKGITAAFVTEREKKDKKDEAVIQRAHEEKVAGIKSQKTWEEQDFEKRYKEAQIRNLETQVESREKKDKKTPYIKPRGLMFAPVVEPESMPEPEPAKDGSVINALPEPEEIKGTSAAPLQGTEPVQKNLFAPVSEDRFGSLKGNKKGIAFETYKPEPSILDIAGAPSPTAESVAQPAPAKPLTEAEEIAQLSEEQRNAMYPEMPVAVFAEPPSIKQVRTQELLGNYEDYEEALMAREELARRMPNYDVPDVTEEVLEDGTSYFSIKAPKQKTTSKKAGVPEGMTVSKGKIDSEGKVTLDIEPTPDAKKQVRALKEPISDLDLMLRTIKQIRSIYEGISPGVGGVANWLSYIPGTDAADVSRLVETLQGNIAFKKLAEMKAASPTGGALGAISEKELALLASSAGSIDPALSFFLFKDNIDQIESGALKAKQILEEDIASIEKPQKFTPIQSAPQNAIQIKSQEEWKKLKSGQKYIFNGVTGTKK